MKFIQVSAGDYVTLKKSHPCGSFEWEVARTGADIGLKCLRCGRRVMLPRDEFERRVKSVDSTNRLSQINTEMCGAPPVDSSLEDTF